MARPYRAVLATRFTGSLDFERWLNDAGLRIKKSVDFDNCYHLYY